jgi:serine/threonine-protein kinase
MNDDRWSRIDAIFAAALTLPRGERRAYAERACADDPGLLSELEALLAAADAVDAERGPEWPRLQDVGAAALQGIGQANPDVPPEVGRYRLLRRIGRGGMGFVYLAERSDGAFEHTVALKIADSAGRTSAIIGRFLRERQILARLQHPSIARLYDGGFTVDGRPYFAMEYVEGVPITEFCDARALDVPERLRLFQEVARAVQYAHRNLVIHRDLKPTNILVTSEGRPKLLDFGIAKLLTEKDGEGALTVTRTDARMLTPAYAAPEQVRGEPITTASDVYQLGVLLYELLVGQHPFRTAGRTPYEIEQAVLDEEPRRPSSVRSTIDRDLDSILLQALHKEPERRYAAASAFLEDTERYLTGLPVTARAGSPTYRLGKFVRRHRLGVGVAALFTLLLGGYAVTVTAQARQIAAERSRAEAERDRAQLEADKAEQVSSFLAGLFESANPYSDEQDGPDIRVRDVMERGAVRVREELADQPEVSAELLELIGKVYQNLGMYEEVRPLYDEALAIRERLHPGPHEETGETLSLLGFLQQEAGEYEESEATFRRALEMQRAVHPPGNPAIAMTLTRLGGLLWFNNGDYAGAEAAFREAIDIHRSAGSADGDLASSLNGMANVFHSQAEYESAEPFYAEAIERYQRHYGGDHPFVAIVQTNFAALLRDKGDLSGAEAVQRDALGMLRRLQGEENIDVALGFGTLGTILLEQDRLAEADTLLKRALTLIGGIVGEGHPYTLRTRGHIAKLRLAQGRVAEAAADLAPLRADFAAAFPEGHFAHSEPLAILGRMHLQEGRPESAEPLLREALAIREAAYPDSHWQIAEARLLLGASLAAQERRAEAEPLLIAALTALEERRGASDPYAREALGQLVRLYAAWGRPEEAEVYRARLAEF